jgi:hypothetical protein
MQTLAAHDTGVHIHTKRETVMAYALSAAWNPRHGPEQDCVMHAVGTYSQINHSKETPTPHNTPNSKLCSHASVTIHTFGVPCISNMTKYSSSDVYTLLQEVPFNTQQ